MLLQGANVRLRRAEPSDLEDRWRWNNDPRVMQFLPRSAVPASREQLLAWLRKSAEDPGDAIELAVETSDGRHIGGASLRDFDWKTRKAEFAIMIGEPECWGKGHGTDVTRLLLELGFDRLNLNRIWLTVDAEHSAAIRAYDKAGFREEGRLRQDRFLRGAYGDTILMAILREEWEAQREMSTAGDSAAAGDSADPAAEPDGAGLGAKSGEPRVS